MIFIPFERPTRVVYQAHGAKLAVPRGKNFCNATWKMVSIIHHNKSFKIAAKSFDVDVIEYNDDKNYKKKDFCFMLIID